MSNKHDSLEALEAFGNQQMALQQESLAGYEQALESLGSEVPPEVAKAIQSMKASADPNSPDFDPDRMMAGQLRGVLQMGSLGGADPTASLLEASATDGGELILLARITPQHLAGIRALAPMAGSYEAALHIVLNSFGRK